MFHAVTWHIKEDQVSVVDQTVDPFVTSPS